MTKEISYHHDALGRPIAVGDTILTKGYNSTSMNLTTTVEAITKTRIRVSMRARYYAWDYTAQKYKWNTIEGKRMYRYPSDVVVINEQLAYNKQEYPEAYI